MALSALNGPSIESARLPRLHRLLHSSCHNLLTQHVLLLILLSSFIEASSAQLDPVKNFCRRFGHQTAVIDQKLYIDGGFINYNPLSQYPTNYSSE